MTQKTVQIKNKTVEGFEIPLKDGVTLVFIKTEKGLIGCGAFDVMGLDKFGYPAAKVKPHGNSVTSIEDLLSGEIAAVNTAGEKAGITLGMKGKEAAEHIL